jgi:type I restriction enzyme S subunit
MTVDMVPLGELCSIRKGLSYKGEFIGQEGPALLGIGTIQEGGGFRNDNIRTYGGPYKTENVLNHGDVYLALTNLAELHRRFLGSAAKVPHDLPHLGITTHHVAKVIWKTDDMMMQDYLYWVMHTPDFLQHCAYFGIGTTVYSTHSKDVERFEVPNHLNRRQKTTTQLLNSIAESQNKLDKVHNCIQSKIQALFRSWFIDFDPVKAKAESKLPCGMNEETAALFPDSLEDSEVGSIPAGWMVKSIHDIATQRKDVANVGEFNDRVPYIGLEHMPRGSIALNAWGDAGRLESNKFRFSTGDILFGKLRPYFHKVGLAPIEGVCSTDILVLNPIDKDDREFLLSIVSSPQFVNFVSAVSEGVSLPRTKWVHFKLHKFALPPVELRKKFSDTIRPLLTLIQLNIHHSRSLSESRDALLPRLISGEL